MHEAGRARGDHSLIRGLGSMRLEGIGDHESGENHYMHEAGVEEGTVNHGTGELEETGDH